MQSPLSMQTGCHCSSPSGRVAILNKHDALRTIIQSRRQPSEPPLRNARCRARDTYRTVLIASAQQTQTKLSKAEQFGDVYTVSLRTSEARKSIRFTQAKDGRIVIEAVAIGSEAQQVQSTRS